jgi:Fe-S-cluster containining protein
VSRPDIEPTLPKKLRRIYAQVPPGECKGLCHESCSKVPCTPIELEAAVRAGGQAPQTSSSCRFLTPEKRCAIYASRPLVCRLFGVSKDRRLACPHGCAPTLPAAKAAALLHEVVQLSPGIRSLDTEIDGVMLFGGEAR